MEIASGQDFRLVAIETGLLLDLSNDAFPTLVNGWNGEVLNLPERMTHFGMVIEGNCILMVERRAVRLVPGMFFVLPKAGTVLGLESKGLVVSRLQYRGLF